MGVDRRHTIRAKLTNLTETTQYGHGMILQGVEMALQFNWGMVLHIVE